MKPKGMIRIAKQKSANATYARGRRTFALITSILFRYFGLDSNLRDQLVHVLQSRYGIKREQDTIGMFIKRELRLSMLKG